MARSSLRGQWRCAVVKIIFSQQDAILSNLREELPKLCLFRVEHTYVEVISGKWEGIYSWIAVNYILDRLDHHAKHASASSLGEVGGL